MKILENVASTVAYCRSKYDDKTFEHCEMVAHYAVTNPCVSSDEKAIVYMMAMCHDLLEDTDASIEDICSVTKLEKSLVESILNPLTQDKCEDYSTYIKRLRGASNKYAYIIKLADMKDHLSRAESLTDKLKAKYWQVLPYLL